MPPDTYLIPLVGSCGCFSETGFVFAGLAVDGNADIRFLVVVPLLRSGCQCQLNRLEDDIFLDTLPVRDGLCLLYPTNASDVRSRVRPRWGGDHEKKKKTRGNLEQFASSKKQKTAVQYALIEI